MFKSLLGHNIDTFQKWTLKVLSKDTGGGVWVVSIDRPLIANISADFKIFFKEPRPFKKSKKFSSG